MTPAQSVPIPPAPTVAPAAPTAPAMPDVPSATAGAPTAPRTAAEVAGLRAQSAELRNQIRAVQTRRAEVTRELRHADPFMVRGALEAQIKGLDERVLQLQSDAARTDGLIASAPPALAASTVQLPRGFILLGPNGPSANAVPALLLLLLVLQVLTFVRAGRRRAAAAVESPVLRDAAARLARVEEAVDAIAIEVERVSEGQRFITRALGESGEPRFPERAER